MTPRLFALSALLVTSTALLATPTENTAPAPTEPAPATTPKLLGHVDNERYHAPGDLYSVPLPVLHGDGSVVMDNPEIVVFKDKVSTLLTIASFAMPAFERWQHETTAPKEYLITFFRDNILRDYRQAFPGSSIESARFLPDVFGGAMVAFTLLPGGSAFDPPKPPSPLAIPPMAKRGHLVFVHDQHVYVIAVELAERITRPDTYKFTTVEEDRILFDRLVTVISAMRFGAEKSAPATSESKSPTPAGK